MKPRSRRLPPALMRILLVAFGVRLAAAIWLHDTVPYSDGFYYHQAGILQANDPTFYFQRTTVERFAKLAWWPPGYPMFLGAVYAVAGPHARAAVFVQVLLGTAVCGLVYAIGLRAGGRRAAAIAAWLVALDPTYVFTTNLVASENLYVAWLALGLWLAPGGGRPGLSGVVFGLATLVRAAGAVVPLVVAFWLRRTAQRRAALLLVVGFLATLAPWTLRNALVAGSPAPVCFGGGLNFYFGHNDAPPGYRDLATTPLAGLRDAAAIDRRGYALGLQHIARHPLELVTGAGRKIVALFAPPTYAMHAQSAVAVENAPSDPAAPGARARIATGRPKDAVLHGPLAFLAGLHTYLLLAGTLAAFALLRRRMSPELRLHAALVVTWVALHAVFWAQPRFRYPMELSMALLTAGAVTRAPQPAGKRSA